MLDFNARKNVSKGWGRTMMSRVFATFFSFVAVFLAMACAVDKWDAVDARSQQKTTDNPCGNLWHQCTDSTGKSEHTCCPNGEACGPTCAAGGCCDERDELVRGDAALPAPHVVGKRRPF
jgi:hypothetical protein